MLASYTAIASNPVAVVMVPAVVFVVVLVAATVVL